MKKPILITLFVSLCIPSFAQNKSKYVNIKVNEIEGTTIYDTFGRGLGGANVYRKIDSKSDFTVIHLNVSGDNANYRAKGVYIKLSNGSTLKEEDQPVDCSYSEVNYSYTADFVLDEENIDEFKNNTIVAFSLAGNERKMNKMISERVKEAIMFIYSQKSK